MKKKKKNKNLRKKKFIILGVVALLVLGFQGLRAATYKFHGFMWMGSNTYPDRVSGDATIGMVSLRGTTADNKTYEVILNESSDGGATRLLTGDAWMGIGSKNGQFKNFKEDNYNTNSSVTSAINKGSLGWIRFNQGVPPENCFGAGDCHPARWNKKIGTTEGSLEGYLSGWAKFLIGGYGTEAGSVQWNKITDDTSSPATSNFLNYPEVWVHFKAPSNVNNYFCDLAKDNHNYVCVDNLGRLSGFAWSSGSDFNSLNNNPGFGWIGFNQDSESQSLAFLSTESANLADISRFCSTRLSSGSDLVCKNPGDTSKSFNFSAYYSDSSILVSSVNRDSHFRWRCKGESAESYTYGENITCNYTQVGTFIPKLEIEDSSTGKWIACAGQAVANIVDKPECAVLVRKADTTSEDEFLQEISLDKDDLVEAKVLRTCLPSGSPIWTTDGRIIYTDSDSIKLNLALNSAITKVSATINGTACSTAQIYTKDSMEWR